MGDLNTAKHQLSPVSQRVGVKADPGAEFWFLRRGHTGESLRQGVWGSKWWGRWHDRAYQAGLRRSWILRQAQDERHRSRKGAPPAFWRRPESSVSGGWCSYWPKPTSLICSLAAP